MKNAPLPTQGDASWLDLAGKCILVAGVSNRRSVGWQVGKRLQSAGAEVLWLVHTEQRREELAPKLTGSVIACDVTQQEEVDALRRKLREDGVRLHGLVHSIAFANYSEGWKPFHQTNKRDFLEALDVSAFSLVTLAEACRESFDPDASVVTISISTTRMAAENYGYMAPIKAALDSSVVFLAKSFSAFSRIRFNAVRAGLLKTSASAGIPGYLESYLHAEEATLRKRGVATSEVADTVLFLLSGRSAGINAQGLVVDAGMEVNYFDRTIVERVTRIEEAAG